MSDDNYDQDALDAPQDKEARTSKSLTVELPIASGGAGGGGSGDYDVDDDSDASKDSADLRAQAGLNSPKLDDDIGNATPDERDKMGINSPRRSQIEQKGWGVAATDEPKKEADPDAGPPPGFITQVSRDDPAHNPITSVQKDDDDDNTQDTMEAEMRTAKPSWWSCFACCGGNTVVDDDQKPPVPQPKPAQTKAAAEKPAEAAQAASNGAAPEKVPDNDVSVSDSDDDFDENGLLPPLHPDDKGKKCLVLDLDETLVHSSFKPVPNADFIIPVEIDNVVHRVYVMKRPYVDEFLRRCAECYEVVIFTASLAKYANPLLDQLDPENTIRHRLFRESCVIHQTAYVKDLTRLSRSIKKTIIVDNSAQSYAFQPKNAIPIASWFDDMSDTQLMDLLPVLETTLKEVKDVRKVLDAHTKTYRWLCNQANKTAQYS